MPATQPRQRRNPFRRLVSDHTYVIFYLLLAAGFVLLDWDGMSPLGLIASLAIASFVADFVSGLWHLFVDYYPLNHKLGYDQLLFFKGRWDSEEFNALQNRIMAKGTAMDRMAYTYKLHHKYPKCNLSTNSKFKDTAAGAFAALAYAFVLLYQYQLENTSGNWLLSLLQETPEYIFGVLVFTLLVANIEQIHHCVHCPRLFPLSGRIVGFLQKVGLIYSTRTHTRHHRGDGVGFCFVTGHANFLVGMVRNLLLRRGIITEQRWHGGL